MVIIEGFRESLEFSTTRPFSLTYPCQLTCLRAQTNKSLTRYATSLDKSPTPQDSA